MTNNEIIGVSLFMGVVGSGLAAGDMGVGVFLLGASGVGLGTLIVRYLDETY